MHRTTKAARFDPQKDQRFELVEAPRSSWKANPVPIPKSQEPTPASICAQRGESSRAPQRAMLEISVRLMSPSSAYVVDSDGARPPV
jgi:hypothetical protein